MRGRDEVGRSAEADGLPMNGASVSAESPPSRVGIPSAAPTLPLWVDRRRSEYRIELENGPVLLSLPWVLTRPELADLDDFFSLVASAVTRRASAIEARSDETGTGSARQGESAVPLAADAHPSPAHPTPEAS